MKRLLNHKKVELSVLFFCLLVPVILWGCGKDDKDVAQNPLGPAYTSAGAISNTYFANPPTSLTLADVTGGVQLSWLTPSPSTNLTAYSISNSKDGGSSWAPLALISNTLNTFTDTTATVVGTSYFYRVAASFNVYDTVSNSNTSVLSQPTEIKSIKK